MEKENYCFERLSLKKEAIYRVYCIKRYSNRKGCDIPEIKIVFKLCDVINDKDDFGNYSFSFESDESCVRVHSKLINVLNNSKDDEFIDIGLICDETIDEINKQNELKSETLYYKTNN